MSLLFSFIKTFFPTDIFREQIRKMYRPELSSFNNSTVCSKITSNLSKDFGSPLKTSFFLFVTRLAELNFPPISAALWLQLGF